MKKKFNVPALVLGSGKTAPGITKALGIMGIPVVSIFYENQKTRYISKYSAAKIMSPDPAADEKRFVQFLKERAEEYSKGVLIPSDQISLAAISKYRKALNEFSNPVDSWKLIKQALDSYSCISSAHSAGILSPRVFSPCNIDQAFWFVEETGYPVYLKAASGVNLKDIFKSDSVFIENENHLRIAFNLADKFGRKIFLQEYIPAEKNADVIYSSYSVNSEPLQEFTAEVVRFSSLETPGIMISRYVPDIFEPARNILKMLKYSGYSSIQFRRDKRNGIYKFIKLTPEFDNSVSLALRCGINFPYSSYVFLSKGIKPETCSAFKEGIYWIDAAMDIKNYKNEKLRFYEFIKPYTGRKVFSVPSFSDPALFLKSSVKGLGSAAKKVKDVIVKKNREFMSQ
jgi:D-aspartate ligase